MKALGYVRVSTEQQVKEGVSLDNQRDRIRQYCTYKGFELADILEDAGISGGKNAGREGFCALLNAIESREIDVLVIYSLERLSRDMLTLLAFERLLDECDIELHTIEGQVDTGTADGWMSFAMKAFMGEMERRQVKQRTRRAMQYKKSQHAVVGAVPYGFQRNGDSLIEDATEQAIKRQANAIYSNTGNLSAVCRALANGGFRTRNGAEFDTTQVRRIIDGYQSRFHRKHSHIGATICNFIREAA